jgi:hypothetical protein
MCVQPGTGLVLLRMHGEAPVDADCVRDSGASKEGGPMKTRVYVAGPISKGDLAEMMTIAHEGEVATA